MGVVERVCDIVDEEEAPPDAETLGVKEFIAE